MVHGKSLTMNAISPYDSLIAEVNQMHEEDQKVRFEIMNSGDFTNIEERFKPITEMNERHLVRLKTLIEEYGWPQLSQVGKEVATRTWLLIQHGDADLPFQKKCLELIKAAAEQGEAQKSHVAYLTDRILLNEGKPQWYGTQCQIQENQVRLRPIQDLETLDERRKSMDLNPIEEYLTEIKKQHHLL